MSWSCGIVGLPNAGKSTLFKALTMVDAAIDNYPFTTIDPNIAVVPLHDPRLGTLAALCSSKKTTPPVIRIVDVAGLVKGASRGEGLGNRFLGELRNVDILIHVVAGFEPFEDGGDDPASRAAVVNMELVLADLETLARRREKISPQLKSGAPEAAAELVFLERLEGHLQRGLPARLLDADTSEKVFLDDLFLLTAKKMIYVFNERENDGHVSPPERLVEMARVEESPFIPIRARLEAEIGELPDDDKKLFLAEYGLKESQVQGLLDECRLLLDLITFYTVKGEESRAWLLPRGSTALEAAFKVHTDMGKGFIKAGVIPWDRLAELGGISAAREQGALRTEGRDYSLADGDVLYFHFRA